MSRPKSGWNPDAQVVNTKASFRLECGGGCGRIILSTTSNGRIDVCAECVETGGTFASLLELAYEGVLR